MELRDYQKKCLEEIEKAGQGNYLVQLMTGGGKTIIFTHLINNTRGNCLIISHREELVNQPIKYIDDKVGIEMGKLKSNGERVISTCIQSLHSRLNKFDIHHFELIIIDECHHAAAESYQKVINYFKPKLLLGFTATPNRHDKKSLSHIFDRIIFKYNLLRGIKEKYLSDIYCKRVYVKYDLRKVKSYKGDYKISDLEKELIENENPKAIGDIYKLHAKGATLIFGASVKHCEEIQKYIPNSMVVSATTKNRADVIKDFTNRKIKCLINCMIFTEGTDIPFIETIIIARPTKNATLYQQMVGRGLRLAEGKEKLILIDVVGVSTDINLCTAPTLIGIDYNDEKAKKVKKEEILEGLSGNLFDLPDMIEKEDQHPDNWKINYKVVNLWAKKNGYNLHDVNWFKHADGSFSLQFPGVNFRTSPIDELEKITFCDKEYEAQDFFDKVYTQLQKKYSEYKHIWDLTIVKKWGYKEATEKQKNIIKKYYPDYDISNLNALQASQILNKLFSK